MYEALVIIDMQAYFKTALHKGTIRNCITQIRKAIKEEISILVLEYEDLDDEDRIGDTLPKLKKHLDPYCETHYIKKHQDDGGHDIINYIEDEGIGLIQKFRVCGVNITACVASTVDTLINEWDAEIEIIKKACNDRSCWRTKRAMFNESTVYDEENVVLV